MFLQIQTNSGVTANLKVLIDTGAEANLIRKGVLNASCFRNSKNPIRLFTADGSPMNGGAYEVSTKVRFFSGREGENKIEEFLPADFYVADIKIDAILSTPWLGSQQLGVFPHLGALARADSHSLLLRGEARGAPRISGNKKRNGVSVVSGTPTPADQKTKRQKRRQRYKKGKAQTLLEERKEKEAAVPFSFSASLENQAKKDKEFRLFPQEMEIIQSALQKSEKEDEEKLCALIFAPEENAVQGTEVEELREKNKKRI